MIAAAVRFVARLGFLALVVVLTQTGCASMPAMPDVPKAPPRAKELPGRVAAKAMLAAQLSCSAYDVCRALDQCPPDPDADRDCQPCRE